MGNFQKYYELLYLSDIPIGVLDYLEDFPEEKTVYIGIYMIKSRLSSSRFGKKYFFGIGKTFKSKDFKIRLAIISENRIIFIFISYGIYREGGKNLKEKSGLQKESHHSGEKFESIIHPFPIFYEKFSIILILGSFPSVKSREENFFYGHPQNRFWKMLAKKFLKKLFRNPRKKKELLRKHRLAVWDVIHSCKIKGSSDSSIQDVIPNDLTEILKL